MRVLWSIHLYPPKHNCGAEYVAHMVNKYLISKGHEVRVLLNYGDRGALPYTFDGVLVNTRLQGIEHFFWPDVVLTHLDFTRHTMNVCQVVKRPVVHFMHNSAVEYYKFITEGVHKQYMVYNSDWVAKAFSFPFMEMVLYPPCPAKEYRVPGIDPKKNKYITLINTNENKGGFLLYRLAKMMPDQQFLGIEGSYDDGGLQGDILELLQELPNVTIRPHSPDAKGIYRETRILLVPSRYESWGRVATEAMVNGIPVLATPTPGLLENLGPAGIFLPERAEALKTKLGDIVEHDGFTYPVEKIRDAINRLNSRYNYWEASTNCIQRANYLEYCQETQLQQLESFLYEVQKDFVGRYYGQSTDY